MRRYSYPTLKDRLVDLFNRAVDEGWAKFACNLFLLGVMLNEAYYHLRPAVKQLHEPYKTIFGSVVYILMLIWLMRD